MAFVWNAAEVQIHCVTENLWDNWLTWGDDREDAEANYKKALKGRWPKTRPLYRVIAKRKAA